MLKGKYGKIRLLGRLRSPFFLLKFALALAILQCPSIAIITQTQLAGPHPPRAGPHTLLAGHQTPLAGPQTPLAGPHTPTASPQTPLAGPQTPLDGWMDGQTDRRKGGMDRQTDGQTDSPFYRTLSPIGAAALLPITSKK